jgi:hypothetical protein
MERTPLPPRVDIDALRRQIERRRTAGYSTTSLDNDELESLLIEAALFRNHYDSSRRRQKDGTRARKAQPRNITLQNADEHDGD